MKRLSYLIVIAVAAFGCGGRTGDPGDFTPNEIRLINTIGQEGGPDGTMRVLTIEDRADSLILRDTSTMLSAKALMSEEYATLCTLMVATVTHPSQDGVGIAGPQVGLNRRVVAVQRFDKEGEPFEVYGNIRIVWTSDSLAYGPEGCLSVPDMRGDVVRSQEVVIEYADIAALVSMNQELSSTHDLPATHEIPICRDTISGFTAVIFQHETDHLDGILYTDRLQ